MRDSIQAEFLHSDERKVGIHNPLVGFKRLSSARKSIFLRHSFPVVNHLTWKTSATTRLMCMTLPVPSETEITADSQECFHVNMYKNKLEFLRESPFLNN